MSVYIDPTRAQFDAFKSLPRDVPIHMLNLVKMRARAAYPILTKVGCEIVWRGAFATGLIGPDDMAWDVMFIAQYPDAHAFLAMISDPVYKSGVVHRQAAVETSQLIRTHPLPASDTFS